MYNVTKTPDLSNCSAFNFINLIKFTSLNFEVCSLEYRSVFFFDLSVIKHFMSLNRWENARGDLTHERLHRHLVMRSSNKSTLIIQNPEQ